MPEMGTREIHDRTAEIRLEGIGVPEIAEPAEQPDEGLLHQVLGEGPVAGDQVREPGGVGGVPPVQLVQPARIAHVLRLAVFGLDPDHLP
jgi:hypothetical protein